jgi:REP element-mobilizing transposase RayT
MRSRYKIYNPGNTYFITSSILNWTKIFTTEKYFDILIEAIKYNQEQKSLEIFAYVIMKDHFHLICRAEKLVNVISSIKSYSAKQIIKQLKEDDKGEVLKIFEDNKIQYKTDRQYQVWQEGFHPQEIFGDSMFQQKMNYIHFNPVKAVYVDDILKWDYRSARECFGEGDGVIRLEWR